MWICLIQFLLVEVVVQTIVQPLFFCLITL